MGDGDFAGLARVLGNFADQLPAIWMFVYVAFILGGVWLGVSGLLAFAKESAKGGYNHNSIDGIKSLLVPLLIGGALINLVAMLDIASASFFATAAPTGLDYGGSATGPVRDLMRFSIGSIMLIGLIGFGSGFYGLSDDQSNRDKRWRSIWKIIGGSAAVNIVVIANFFGAQMGDDYQSSISYLFGASMPTLLP